VSSIVIIGAYCVVFTQIAAGLNLDGFEMAFPWDFQIMACTATATEDDWGDG
jgi:hypothetical protein